MDIILIKELRRTWSYYLDSHKEKIYEQGRLKDFNKVLELIEINDLALANI
jgi:hypothetical protein